MNHDKKKKQQMIRSYDHIVKYTINDLSTFWYQNLKPRINNFSVNDEYPGLRIAKISFTKDEIKMYDTELIEFSVMYLLVKYGYTTLSDYGKFTISYVIMKNKMRIPFTKGRSIVFRENGQDLSVHNYISEYVSIAAEEYKDADVVSIIIRIYLNDINPGPLVNISDDNEIIMNINKWFKLSKSKRLNAVPVGGSGRSKRKHSQYMTPLTPSIRSSRGFIVADTETLLFNKQDTLETNNKVHIPYAIGFLVVNPGDDLSSLTSNVIERYFSEEYPSFVFPTFEERSSKMMNDFVDRLAILCEKERKINTVYFHNFSRFDGIILLKHFLNLGSKYRIKPMIMNNLLYEISVYKGKNLIFRLRDSYTLLPSSLKSLAKNLCPSLGSKGSIDHNSVTVSNLRDLKDELLTYMIQDIRLLGGIMLKAQEIYMSNYSVDIVSKLTVSSLALTIFRTRYYDKDKFPIYVPSMNEDHFIRRGYYGGHTDAYIPYGEDLYYYDVNSLYPFIMKSFPMPGGKAVWHNKLEDHDLDNLCGFIEAYVKCPSNMKRPFLPYRDSKKKTLIFPTGQFVGVYYSEELKYARNLGYQIIPLKGYLFDKTDCSPFESFVENIFEKRQEAKRNGNDAMSYIYKTLMNSLYGRFGINPECEVTVICDYDQYIQFMKDSHFKYGTKLSEYHYLVTYLPNKELDNTEWKAPKLSAVQLSAAITACARIYMYPFISRDDCNYTDTDSVVLGSPLPEDFLSETDLGKFKCEYSIKKGIFLAAKSYSIQTKDGRSIIKQKGISKSLVDQSWFQEQYKDIERIKEGYVTSPFSIDRDKWEIREKTTNVKLGVHLGNKRKPIFNNHKHFIDTKPIKVNDLEDTETKLRVEVKKLKEINAKKDRQILRLKQRDQIMKQQSKKTLIKEIDKQAGNKEKEIGKKTVKKKIDKEMQDNKVQYEETDKCKDEGRDKTIEAEGVHETKDQTRKEEVKEKQPKLYDNKTKKKGNKKYNKPKKKGNKPTGNPTPHKPPWTKGEK